MEKEVSICSGSKGSFEGLYTFMEVAKIYGIDDSSLRKQVARGKLIVGVDVKKMGRIWIITEQAMIKNFGDLKLEEYKKSNGEKLNSKKTSSKIGKYSKKIYSMNSKEEKIKDSWVSGDIEGMEIKTFSF